MCKEKDLYDIQKNTPEARRFMTENGVKAFKLGLKSWNLERHFSIVNRDVENAIKKNRVGFT